MSKGRETLERAIRYIEASSKTRKQWCGCRVVYGDTDSVFVVLPGRTIKEAFAVGQQMAEAITNDNPKPVTTQLVGRSNHRAPSGYADVPPPATEPRHVCGMH